MTPSIVLSPPILDSAQIEALSAIVAVRNGWIAEILWLLRQTRNISLSAVEPCHKLDRDREIAAMQARLSLSLYKALMTEELIDPETNAVRLDQWKTKLIDECPIQV